MGITRTEKNIIKSALLFGAYKGVTWGDICEQKKKEQKKQYRLHQR